MCGKIPYGIVQSILLKGCVDSNHFRSRVLVEGLRRIPDNASPRFWERFRPHATSDQFPKSHSQPFLSIAMALVAQRGAPNQNQPFGPSPAACAGGLPPTFPLGILVAQLT
jgi:hypothetical protein